MFSMQRKLAVPVLAMVVESMAGGSRLGQLGMGIMIFLHSVRCFSIHDFHRHSHRKEE
jgi:hypothetical protein